MTKTYTERVSGDNLSHESMCGIMIIQLLLEKWGETVMLPSIAHCLIRALSPLAVSFHSQTCPIKFASAPSFPDEICFRTMLVQASWSVGHR